MFNNQVIAGSSGQGGGFYDFPIEQSLRFNDDDNAYLSRTPASAGNRKTWTFSCWVKRGKVSGTDAQILTAYTSASDTTNIIFQSGGAIQWYDYISGYRVHLVTNALYRDVGSWYHLLFQLDTSNASSGDRAKIYVNGERVTSFSTEVYPSLNADLKMNTAIEHRIGDTAQFAREFDGYMADVNFIDGTAYTADSFGEFKSGIWIPKDTADLTFGTNGFRLQFGDTTEANGFNTVTYTGNGGTQSISGVSFSSAPDMVWIKQRSSPADNHRLFNSVVGATKYLVPDDTYTETTDANTLTSFDNDGFTLGSSGIVNESGKEFVAWTWDAGSGSAASNTDGDITSTVKANTDYGFSIVSYTGTGANATVGHGLGVTPDMYIVKNRDQTGDWCVYHKDMDSTPEDFYMLLNTTNAKIDNATIWNDTAPTSTTFSIGSYLYGNTIDYIAYCFAEKTGYSSISSYTGNGSASGPTITTGFRPAFVMIKRTDSANSWTIQDNTRDTSNPIDLYLLADDPGAEGTSGLSVDFLSDGFQIKTTSAAINASGGSYIYMAFADTRNAAFWKDTSGEGNDWQPNNLVFNDVVPDSNSNNFATMNILDDNYASPKFSYSEGNLKYTYGYTGAGFDRVFGSIAISPNDTNKYYFEFTGNVTNEQMQWGVVSTDSLAYSVADRDNGLSATANASQLRWVSYLSAPYLYRIDSSTTDEGTLLTTSNGNAANGDIYSLVYDADAGKFYAWFNGVEFTGQNYAAGTSLWATMDTSKTYMVMMYQGDGGVTTKSGNMTANFGQDSSFAGAKARQGNTDANGLGDFYYPVPDGALALCTANLPRGAINTLNDETPEDYFNTVLYSGNSTNNTPITVGFQPSMTWIKTRSVVRDHRLMDAVRGATAGVYPNLTNAEGGSPLISFDTDGFTLNNTDNYNNSGETYAAWNWKAGGTGVSNTDGSITSTVSVGATSQQNWFSIVSYTGNNTDGATVGHGLGVVPSLIITKSRSATSLTGWMTKHKDLASNYNVALNKTDAAWNPSSNGWVGDLTSDTTFSLENGTVNGNNANQSGVTYIAYCFANAENLCRVGSYVGNGSTDGTFVYTGFRPAFLITKHISSGNWAMWDNRRDPENVIDNLLYPNLSHAQNTGTDRFDFLSNGFKCKNTNDANAWNASGVEYLFLSIAEQPFKFANAR